MCAGSMVLLCGYGCRSSVEGLQRSEFVLCAVQLLARLSLPPSLLHWQAVKEMPRDSKEQQMSLSKLLKGGLYSGLHKGLDTRSLELWRISEFLQGFLQWTCFLHLAGQSSVCKAQFEATLRFDFPKSYTLKS